MINMKKANVAVLVSGGGTNLQALIDAHSRGEMEHVKLSVVISSSRNAHAIQRAKHAGIRVYTASPKEYPDEEFENIMLRLFQKFNIDLVVLGGYLPILSKNFVNLYSKRIIGVHPSLFPNFCGKGMYGLHVHEAVLKSGVSFTGATVYFINEVLDGGDIIFQQKVEVKEDDTPETLQKRVMEKAEWILLPRATEMLAKQICLTKQ